MRHTPMTNLPSFEFASDNDDGGARQNTIIGYSKLVKENEEKLLENIRSEMSTQFDCFEKKLDFLKNLISEMKVQNDSNVKEIGKELIEIKRVMKPEGRIVSIYSHEEGCEKYKILERKYKLRNKYGQTRKKKKLSEV